MSLRSGPRSASHRSVVANMLAAGALVAGLLAPVFFAGSTASAAMMPPAQCTAAAKTGLTAAVVAKKGQKIVGTIVDAQGCDVGIYVPPTASGVVINGVVVAGANDHGIFVQNASGVRIENSTVDGNGLAPHACPPPPKKPTGPCIAEDKGIELVGTSGGIVKDNIVVGNRADGGIGIADDGTLDPGATLPGIRHAASGNVVTGNTVSGNLNGCAIVVAAYNAGAGVARNVVSANTVTSGVAGIVVAADTPGTTAIKNVVEGNTIVRNFLPGVIVHSNAPGDLVSGTLVKGNLFSRNLGDAGAYGGAGPKVPTAVVVIAEPLPPNVPHAPRVTSTTVADNTIVDEGDSVWIGGATGTVVTGSVLGPGVNGTVSA